MSADGIIEGPDGELEWAMAEDEKVTQSRTATKETEYLRNPRRIASQDKSMTTPNIKIATAADEAAVLDVMTLAFSADPPSRWTYPDPRQYLRHYPSFVRAFGGKALAHGSAYYVDGYAAAALWLPPDVHPDEEALASLLQRTASEATRRDGLALFEQMGRYHPKEPHWYLPLIGVDPSQQGKGYGAALLAHALLRCDRDHALAYLESTSPKSVPLYERHGFALLGTIQVGTSPPVFPMLRKPR